LPVILLACAATMDFSARTDAGASFCAVAKPILWSARDTDETIVQAKEHNAVGIKLCGWGGQKKDEARKEVGEQTLRASGL
jgi:hypothetical protein